MPRQVTASAGSLGNWDFPPDGAATCSARQSDHGARMTRTPAPVPAASPGIFHGALGEIALDLAEGSEADPIGIYASLQGTASVLIGAGPYVKIDTRHPLLIWPLLMGRTGGGRKGTAGDLAHEVARAGCPD